MTTLPVKGPDQDAPNQVAGTWSIVSVQIDPDGADIQPFGAEPSGLLIFTRDGYFSVVINRTDVPAFADEDFTKGTDAENKAAVAGAIAVYGRYTVDAEGRFASEHILGSTFPNWIGRDRTSATLSETVDGDMMVEHLQDPGKPLMKVVYRRLG